MPMNPGPLLRRTLTVIAVLVCMALPGSRAGWAATALRLSLDRPIDGAAAPFVVAASRGIFRNEDLAVTIDAANGSSDAIARVASGASEMALADLNVLIRYRDKDGAAPLKAVFVLHERPAYAIIARKSRGIGTMADLKGKVLGLVEGDPAAALWPALARLNGINAGAVHAERVSAAVREPLLSAGQADAVTGFSYLSAINLRDRGVPANDLVTLRYADFGIAVYGAALIVNPKFAAERPEAVKAFLRAAVTGIRLAASDPGRAIDDVLAQASGASRMLELERLRAVLHDNILTDAAKRQGLGTLDAQRFATGLDQLAEGQPLRKRPSAEDIFDDSFLPPLRTRTME
jgi:NitT/TauT family transport system substrate-binding protein